MKPLTICLMCGIALAVPAGVGSLRAQPPVPGAGLGGAPRPPFSPYLNLNRQGGNSALNYYGLVRPQTQFQQSIQNLQGAVGANQQSIGNLQTDSLGMAQSPTGHAAGFMTYSGYFLNNQGFGAAGGQQNRFTNQNTRTPQPGSGINPGGGPGGGIRRR